MIAGATDEGVCLLEFTDRRMLEAQLQRLSRLLGQPMVPGEHRHLTQLREELTKYFAGTLHRLHDAADLPRDAVRGARLARADPHSLRRDDLVRAARRPHRRTRRQRAVGRANGMNRIAIVIPCHRVVNADGKLGGYGGGLWRKNWLLELESERSVDGPRLELET